MVRLITPVDPSILNPDEPTNVPAGDEGTVGAGLDAFLQKLGVP